MTSKPSTISDPVAQFFHELGAVPIVSYAQTQEGEVSMFLLSPSAEKILGRSVGEFTAGARIWLDLVHPSDRPWVEKAMQRAHEDKKEIQLQYRVLSASGWRWFFDLASVESDRSSGKTLLKGVRIDVTQSKNLATQAQHFQKVEASGLMASKIAHEFNNLLTLVCSYTSFAAEALGDHAAQGDLAQVQKATERAVTFTRRLLGLSPKRTTVAEGCDIKTFLEWAESSFRKHLGDRITLRIHATTRIHPARILPGQLEQLLLILLDNAQDAMPEGGSVEILSENLPASQSAPEYDGTRGVEEYICLRVTDTGPGLSDEMKAQLFVPFYSTKTPKGRGFGLATAFGIVKRHGGHIEASTLPTGGTSFKILLPRFRPAVPEEPKVLAPNWEKDSHTAQRALRSHS